MFKLSKAAAGEIKRSLAEHEFDDMPLRIAAQRGPDGAIHYQMGFDEAGRGDMMLASRGVDVVIARQHKELLNGVEMDYVTLDNGNTNFIFLNPNDPGYVAPESVSSDGGHDFPAV